MTRIILALLGVLAFGASVAIAQGTVAPNRTTATKLMETRGDVTGTVVDSSNGQPLPTIEVTVMQGARFVAGTFTDAFGRYTIHNISPGAYTVRARLIGYRTDTQAATIEAGK